MRRPADMIAAGLAERPADTPQATVMTTPAPATAPRPYVPAIDGLRAVAVIAVILFHLDARVLPGGFIGVDIFFVLSGSLLAPIVMDAVDGGRGAIPAFYQRRIARIFPGAALALAATLACGIWLLEGRTAGVLAHDAAATALMVSNFRFAAAADYWRMADDARPLLHYWSLAVEEQFYLLFPLAMVAVARTTRHRARAVAALAATGFVIGVALTFTRPEAAFYLLPSRAWELLAGAALGLSGDDRASLPPRWRGPAAWLGVALIGGALIACSRATPFPGFAALAPVAGTLLLLQGAADGSLRVTRLLAARAPVWVGRRSFALYLWHWPIFSLADQALYRWPDPALVAVKVSLTLVVSVAAYALVERPARRWLGAPRRRTVAFLLFLLGTAILYLTAAGLAARLMVDATPRSIASGGVRFAGTRPGPVLLVGDSTASSYARQLARACNAAGVTLDVVSISGATELPGNPTWPDIVALAARERPRTIVIAHHWVRRLPTNPAALRAATDALSPYAGRIILLADPPALPRAASLAGIHAGAHPPFVELPSYRRKRLVADQWLKAAAGGKVFFFPTARLFTASDGSVIAADDAGHRLYFDSTHPSETGAARVVAAIAPLAVRKR